MWNEKNTRYAKLKKYLTCHKKITTQHTNKTKLLDMSDRKNYPTCQKKVDMSNRKDYSVCHIQKTTRHVK